MTKTNNSSIIKHNGTKNFNRPDTKQPATYKEMDSGLQYLPAYKNLYLRTC